MRPLSSHQNALVPTGSRALAFNANVSHSVAFWPDDAGTERSVLSVLGDADHVRFWLESTMATSRTLPCVYSARVGTRVRNLEAVAAAPHMQAHLVFDPEQGPGEYELYSRCADHDLVRPDPAWRKALPASPQATSLPTALLVRHETRAAAVGPTWHEPPQGGGYGASRRSLGNVRARLLISAADSGAGAVRALVPWRRRQFPVQTQLYLFHSSGSGGDHSDGRVTNLVLIADSLESAEIVFEPSHGSGEYVLYYLPHHTKWETYDARDDAHGTSYEAFSATYDPGWHRKHARRLESLPIARVFDVQARTHADRFGEMERPATVAELRAVLDAAAAKAAAKAAAAAAAHATAAAKASGGKASGARASTSSPQAHPPRWLLFPESRSHPFRTSGELPERWARRGPAKGLFSHARLGEFFVWQVGLMTPDDS